MIVLLATFSGLSSCKSTYEEDSPYGQTSWSNSIAYFGDRIRDDKLVTLTMMRGKFGKENLIRKMGRDQKEAWWYLVSGSDKISLVVADFEDPDEHVVGARLVESKPAVKRHKMRALGESYVTRINGGKQIPVTTLRAALGVEQEGWSGQSGEMILTWRLYPGFLAGTTEETSNRVVSAEVMEEQ